MAFPKLSCPRFMELLEDDKGRLSTTNVGMMTAVMVLSWVVVHMELNGRTTESIVLAYIGLCLGGLGIKKKFDNTLLLAELNPGALNQPKQVINNQMAPVPAAPVINIGATAPASPVDGKLKADNVEMQVEGDVNVAPTGSAQS